QEGMVIREPNRGARVRLLSDREALEIEEVRAALEQLIARQAAANVTRDDLRDLNRMLTEMRDRVEQSDPLGYSALNGRFHQRIWAIADHVTARRMVAMMKFQTI